MKDRFNTYLTWWSIQTLDNTLIHTLQLVNTPTDENSAHLPFLLEDIIELELAIKQLFLTCGSAVLIFLYNV